MERHRVLVGPGRAKRVEDGFDRDVFKTNPLLGSAVRVDEVGPVDLTGILDRAD